MNKYIHQINDLLAGATPESDVHVVTFDKDSNGRIRYIESTPAIQASLKRQDHVHEAVFLVVENKFKAALPKYKEPSAIDKESIKYQSLSSLITLSRDACSKMFNRPKSTRVYKYYNEILHCICYNSLTYAVNFKYNKPIEEIIDAYIQYREDVEKTDSYKAGKGILQKMNNIMAKYPTMIKHP